MADRVDSTAWTNSLALYWFFTGDQIRLREHQTFSHPIYSCLLLGSQVFVCYTVSASNRYDKVENTFLLIPAWNIHGVLAVWEGI